MTALTQNRGDVGNQQGPLIRIPVEAGETIYKGGLVAIDADGYLMPAADTSGHIWVGVASEAADNSAGADGAVDCLVDIGGALINLTHAAGSQTQANVGDEVTVEDDQTVDVAANTTNDIACGRIIKLVSATVVTVKLYPFSTQS